MSDMNRLIREKRAETRGVEEAARVEQQACSEALHSRNLALWEVAVGLRALTAMLVKARVPPEAWASYGKQPKWLGGSADSGRPYSDGVAKIAWKTSQPAWTSWKDPCWFLGEWRTSYPSRGGDVESTAHNLITASSRVIGSGAQHPYLDLSGISDPDAAARLVLLGPTNRTPDQLASQIVWTAAHYDLEWPADAPDLSHLATRG